MRPDAVSASRQRSRLLTWSRGGQGHITGVAWVLGATFVHGIGPGCVHVPDVGNRRFRELGTAAVRFHARWRFGSIRVSTPSARTLGPGVGGVLIADRQRGFGARLHINACTFAGVVRGCCCLWETDNDREAVAADRRLIQSAAGRPIFVPCTG